MRLTLIVLLLCSSVVADECASFTTDDSGSKQFEHDAKTISIRQVSEFHLLLSRRVVRRLPDECELHYAGALRINNGRSKQEVLGREGGALLSWDVSDDEVVFSVSISTKKGPETVTSVKIDDQTLYVNVGYVHAEQTLDFKFKRLGDRSVREAVMLIHEKNEFYE